MKKYFTVKELSEHLPEKPHPVTIRRWVHEGVIPAIESDRKQGKRIFFKINEINNWLENGRPKNA